MPGNVAVALRLMLVTDDRFLPEARLMRAVEAAVQGGVTSVQLRLKTVCPRQLLVIARAMLYHLPVPVIVNDRPDVARAARAAGVHLGPDDLSPTHARAAWPDAPLIGASVATPDEIEAGVAADYWGVGPWRVTDTKKDAGAAIGAEGFRRIVTRAAGKPCIAIGGIQPGDVRAVLEAGGAGVAVVSAILSAPDVTAAARAFARELA